ncbi:fimbrial protein [Halomonas cupida]|uniref:fimbrial protein n=1 Tax=Halomonas cupida TaxID=44933 RepID=UPI003A8F1127
MKIKALTGTWLGALWMLAILLGGQLALPVAAQAGGADNCSTSQLPWSPVLNARVVGSLAVGSVIPGSDAYQSISINCGSAWSSDSWGTTCRGGPNWALSEQSGATIQQTSLPGVFTFAGLPPSIGYQFMDSGGRPLELDPEGRHNTGVSIRTGVQEVPIYFRLVKLSDSPVAAGSASVSMHLSCNGNEWANQNGSNSTVTLHVNIEQITQTCRMVTPNTAVVLPTVSRPEFTGVGHAVGSTPFTLDFRCDADASARVNISDATTPSNSSEILALQESSTASGMGVRLSHQGVPVTLAPNQMFDQNGSEFSLDSPGSEQVISLPLSAEYVQTNNTITPGTVQALAVVTIAYD